MPNLSKCLVYRCWHFSSYSFKCPGSTVTSTRTAACHSASPRIEWYLIRWAPPLHHGPAQAGALRGCCVWTERSPTYRTARSSFCPHRQLHFSATTQPSYPACASSRPQQHPDPPSGAIKRRRGSATQTQMGHTGASALRVGGGQYSALQSDQRLCRISAQPERTAALIRLNYRQGWNSTHANK